MRFARQKNQAHHRKLKADLGDGEEKFDLEEGYQQQGPPLQQPSQEQEQEAPGSGTTSALLTEMPLYDSGSCCELSLIRCGFVLIT